MALPTSIGEIITHLELIVEESVHRGEREGYFASLYLRVTREIKNKINAHFFDDNARMEQLDVAFANRYLTAYCHYKNHKACSASWRLSFDACRQWPPLVLQHLLLGMNAHISLDLGIAAATICPGESIDCLHHDFNKINLILAGLVDTVRNEITEVWPVLKPINALAGSLEEEIANFSMDIARDAAWQVAQHYATFNTDVQKENFITLRDREVAAFGQKLASPGVMLSSLILALRAFEQGSVKRKIEVLSGK
jgi:hypothetical protein